MRLPLCGADRFWLEPPGICLPLGSCKKLLAGVHDDALTCLVALGYPKVEVGACRMTRT